MARYPRGSLDFLASVYLAANPQLTIEELAGILDCSVGTLRNRAKYPRFAATWEEIKGREFAGVRAAGRRRDRRRKGETSRAD